MTITQAFLTSEISSLWSDNTTGAITPANARTTLNDMVTAIFQTPPLTTVLSGDVSGSGSGPITTTLATVNGNTGTFQGLTVNAKGLVTAANNQNYLTGNQTITLSGNITGSGTTSITTTLASGDASNLTLINNGTSTAVALNKRFVVSVKDFGALGNNTDSTAAFQAAATFFGTTGGPFGVANGGVLLIPKGVYQINAEIDWNAAGISLIGEGVESTKIYVSRNLGASNALFKFTQSNSSYSNVGTNVEGIYIDMQGKTGHAIWMQKPYDGSGLRKVFITQVADSNNAVRIEPDPSNVGDNVSQ